ncbi:hypothetical protein Q7I35_08515 [Aeromonas allosaccharophila]|nr:hypothetical protein [Aeromonas allosaccharophila]
MTRFALQVGAGFTDLIDFEAVIVRERGYLVDIATDFLDDRLLLGSCGGDLVGKIRDLVYLDHNLIQVAGTCPGGGKRWFWSR